MDICVPQMSRDYDCLLVSEACLPRTTDYLNPMARIFWWLLVSIWGIIVLTTKSLPCCKKIPKLVVFYLASFGIFLSCDESRTNKRQCLWKNCEPRRIQGFNQRRVHPYSHQNWSGWHAGLLNNETKIWFQSKQNFLENIDFLCLSNNTSRKRRAKRRSY